MSQICRKQHQRAIAFNIKIIQHYREHGKQVNDMHVSTVLRKISVQSPDGQVKQTLFLTVLKQKLWLYQHHKSQNITNLKKKK